MNSYRGAAETTLWLLILSVVLLTAGCAGIRQQPVSPPLPSYFPSQETPAGSVRKLLEAHLNEWHGVPYRLGGSSRTGIDCSSFIQLTFLERFGLPLPRTTREQVLVGERIGPGALASGDLVFFRTGPDKRHVGIYLGDGRFMHVSYSQGVISSRLSDSYWLRHFWQARRVLLDAGRTAAVE